MCRSSEDRQRLEDVSFGHLALFRHDIKALIDADFLDWIDPDGAIFGDKSAPIRALLSYDGEVERKNEKKTKARDYVFEVLTIDRPELRPRLVEFFLRRCDERTRKELLMEDVPERSKELLLQYFYLREDGNYRLMEFITGFLRPDYLLEDLQTRHGKLYEPLVKELLPLTTATMTAQEREELKKRLGEERTKKKYADLSFKERTPSDVVACLLLRRLPRNEATAESGDWFFHLLEALADNRYHSFLPEHVDTDFEQLLDVHEAEKRAQEVEDEFQARGFEDDYLDDSNLDEFRPQKDFEAYRPSILDGIAIPPPLEIDLRVYQQELVEEVADDKNGIVCAPTGSGKTIVATYLILEHLQKRREEGRPARVAVFVPKVPLVEQQMATFLTYMRLLYNVVGFCGTETVKGRGYLSLANDVIVLTPQIFVNMLSSPKSSDHLNLSDFTMFVFDECHYCQGDHPYKAIMDMVNEYQGPKPRVIGLTASVGVGKNPSVERAINHILKLCVNLNADKIASVQKHKADLLAKVQPPVDEIIRVNRNSASAFLQFVQACISAWDQEFLTIVRSCLAEKIINIDLSKQIREPRVGEMDAYLNFVGTFEHAIKGNPKFPAKARSLRIIEILKAFVIAVEYVDLLPNEFAMNHLARQWGSMKDSIEPETKEIVERFKDELQELINVPPEDCAEAKQILRTLQDLVEKQFAANPESRAIVFVQKRFIAEALQRHLNAVLAPLFGDDHSVGYITSSNQSLAEGGQTGGLQREMLDSFNHGGVKILVATSVVEEGIDVKACNLIIKYNTAGSGTTLIQRKGRGRAAGSKAYLLALNSATESREMEAMQEAILMDLCLKDLRAHGDAALLRRIAETRREVEMVREMERNRQRVLEEELRSKEVAFHCYHCDALICRSPSVRLFVEHTEHRNSADYIVVDPELWSRVHIEPEAGKSHHGAIRVGTYRCANCAAKEHLGMLLAYSDVLLPTLRLKAVVVHDPNDLRDHSKANATWNYVTKRCFIDRSKTSELRSVHRSFVRQFPAKVGLLERLAEEGRIVAARKAMESKEKLKEKRRKERRLAAQTQKTVDALDATYFNGYVNQ
ncbi:hypothetical protein QR680_013429 [Steinernema hermaphroditum]|uniref:RNA helicase n=1 Tax=Steinernema hermaphroditum TaxID=289476 RepID=A0AA39I7S7_9BILA|nr:hypothetical protein QR680_013429 [Steinernema hermaphroditum]